MCGYLTGVSKHMEQMCNYKIIKQQWLLWDPNSPNTTTSNCCYASCSQTCWLSHTQVKSYNKPFKLTEHHFSTSACVLVLFKVSVSAGNFLQTLHPNECLLFCLFVVYDDAFTLIFFPQNKMNGHLAPFVFSYLSCL